MSESSQTNLPTLSTTSVPRAPARMHPRLQSATAWFGRSIGARIVTLSLGLLFAIQIASFSAISASLGQHARPSSTMSYAIGGVCSVSPSAASTFAPRPGSQHAR